MCRRILPFVLLLCIATPSITRAGEFDAVDPSTLGFDVEKLAKIDTLIRGKIKERSLVGALGLVVKNGEVAYFETWGDADREAAKPIKEDTIFRIYSMSKPITSVAVMMLEEQGKLDLDKPVSTYLPQLKKMTVLVSEKDDDGKEKFKRVPAKQEITTRDLLRHTSGLTYGFFGDSEVDKLYLRAGVLVRDKNIAETVANLANLPLKHQPGTRFEYSVSTDVLGRLVEVVSGERFDQFLSNHIFKPLKMTDTFFTVPKGKQDRFATMYTAGEGVNLVPSRPGGSFRFLNENDFYSGGGGLCSTTADYLAFCTMVLNGGELNGERLLKADTIKRMRTNQLDDSATRPGFKFGLGFALKPNGDFYWGGAAGTKFWINDKTKVIGIYMTQINPTRGHDFGEAFKKLVNESLE